MVAVATGEVVVMQWEKEKEKKRKLEILALARGVLVVVAGTGMVAGVVLGLMAEGWRCAGCMGPGLGRRGGTE